MRPLVSIIIPTFNRGLLICETLDTLVTQTYSHWECIIIDDGSIDNTKAVVTSYSQNDNRIKFYTRPDSTKTGASSCRNYGLDKAKGELIQFLDSDDLLAKNKLEEQVKLYKSESLSLITCKWGGFMESSDLSKRFKYKYHSYRNFKKAKYLLNTFGRYNEFFPLHVYLTPRALIEKSGIWNEDISNNDDAEFFTRVILNSSRILFSDKTSVYYRYNSADNLSEINTPEKVESAIKSWRLIETNIMKAGFSNALLYTKNGKSNLFNTIQSKFPEIVVNNRDFFIEKNNRFNFILRFLKEIELIRS